MSNELMIFNNKDFGEVRMVEIDGRPYAVGSDIAKCLGYKRPSKAVSDHCKGVLKQSILTNGGKQEMNVIPQGDIIRLIVKCSLPQADKFERWIFDDVIPQVLSTGKYDVIENKLQQIEDDKERELSLGLYQLEQVLKVNPKDMLTTLAYNNMQQELTTYKQNKKLEEFENKVQVIEANQEDQKKRLESIVAIGDRVQFTNEVNRVSRATGSKHAEIYNLTYLKLKNLYGIDLNARTKNKRQELQNERLDKGLKLYAPSTLKQKVNNLVLADEECLWNELGRSLYAVEQDLLNN